MSATIQRRIKALEANGSGQPPLLILRFIVPMQGEVEPVGIHAAPPHFPEPLDRLPGESWKTFTSRLGNVVASLPGGSVVRAVSRAADL